jgi:Gnt-I system low-affinity gluconate transporter
MSGLIFWVGENQALLATLFAVAALLFMITAARIHAFPALVAAALFAALAAGMAPSEALASIKSGMGGTLGGIAVVIGLGAMFGVLVEASGGVGSLAEWITQKAGPKYAPRLMGVVGVIVAIPVFFDVALIILIPLIVNLAKRAKRAPLVFGLPLLAGLATAHAFIPPTPGPIAVAEQLGADLGWVMLFGLIAGIPAMIVGGPLFARFAEKRGWLETDEDMAVVEVEDIESSFNPRLAKLALVIILLPLFLIVLGTLIQSVSAPDRLKSLFGFLGAPIVALLISCAIAAVVFRPTNEGETKARRDALHRCLEPVGVVLLVTGAGGAFKQVLVDSGAGKALAESTLALGLVPVSAGFFLALLIRIAQGSATASMITAAGLTYPIAAAAGLSAPELALVAVAIAAGATAMSHVNDSGFWLVNRYFGQTTVQTLRTWTVSATLVGFTGFAVAALLTLFV